jgi:hypothetical protein
MSFEKLSQLCEKYPAQAKVELQNLYKGSLYLTAKLLCGYKEVSWSDHQETIQCLEGPSKRKMIVIPRSTFKTSISSVAFPIWLLLNDPNHRIMLDSELYTNSAMRIREIKGHMQSNKFQNIFGDWRGPVWSDGEIIVKPRNKILKEPSIFASGIGAGKTGVHTSVIIADDLNSPMNTNNPENAAKVISHYRYYMSILEPEGTIVLVGTRYASSDLIGFVLREEIGIDSLPEYLKNYAQ